MTRLHTLTITELTKHFNHVESTYRFMLGRIKYFYNRQEYDRIPWEKLNVLDDAMNAIIIAATMKDNKTKIEIKRIERMVNTYHALDERRIQFM